MQEYKGHNMTFSEEGRVLQITNKMQKQLVTFQTEKTTRILLFHPCIHQGAFLFGYNTEYKHFLLCFDWFNPLFSFVVIGQIRQQS